ncbi:MAG: diguanylate cyclase domain-containing protein, partial [Cetobacterium sp.]
MYKIIFIFIYIYFISFSAVEERLKVGLIKSSFLDKKIDGKSFNDIFLDQLKEENIDFQIVEGSWVNLSDKFISGEIDLIFPVGKKFFQDPEIIYSKNVYPQILYIASNKSNMRSINFLEGKVIYALKNTASKKYLEKKLKDSNVRARIIEVDDLSEYTDKIIVSNSSNTQNLNYTYMIGKIPLTLFAYKGSDSRLMDKIDNSLKTKYSKLYNDQKDKVEKEIRKERFLSALTEEEKNFLKGLKELNIAYEENSTVSHYIPETKSYGGLLPMIWEEIGSHLDLKINILNEPYEGWDNLLERFEKREIDNLGVVVHPGRENRYIFSDKLTDIHTYKIYSCKLKEDENPKIGVIDRAIEDYIAREYYPENDITRYKNAFELEKALKENQVSAILHVNSYIAGIQGYNSEIFYSFPMNLAFHKENVILRDIYNKAYRHFIDIDLLTERMIESEKRFSSLKAMEAERLKRLLYRSTVIFLVFILIVLALFFMEKRRKAKELEKIAFFDILSSLGNRYNFTHACKDFNSQEGICIVADLDDFKKANDTHGHHIGDEIIKYYGMVLKNIFGE